MTELKTLKDILKRIIKGHCENPEIIIAYVGILAGLTFIGAIIWEIILRL